MPTMPSTISTEPFRTLAGELKKNGFAAQSARLEQVLDGVWTTSSEMLGELGGVVMAIRKECKAPSPAQRALQKALVRECIRQVRKAWPGFAPFVW